MTFKSKARRAGWLLLVAVFAFGIISAVKPQQTSAYSLISNRYIRMSSSEVSPASGNFNIYSVGFTTVNTTDNVGSMVIRFCSNNPIIGDACTAPAGFNTNFGSLSVNNFNSTTSLAGNNFTLSTTQSTSNALLFTRTSSAPIATASTITFDLGNGTTNGITNPSTTNTSFFARIMLFSSNTNSLPAVANDDEIPSSGGASNAGGVALSTANVLNVTAKVQETLVFCVYTGANCAAGGTAVNLGTSENVLAATNQAYVDSTPKFDLASNALAGVIVRLKGDTLTSGAFTISAVGGTCTQDSTVSSQEQFGVRVVTYGTGQYFGNATTGNTTPDGSANDFGCLAGYHKFDPTATNTTYGQSFVRTVGATDVSTTNFEIAAKAAGTTEAGVYTTKLQLIATATY